MWLIKVGRHTFRFDLIEYMVSHTNSPSVDVGRGITLFLRGRERGIELTTEESESLLHFVGRECVVSDVTASATPDGQIPDLAGEVAWYLVVSPLCRYDQDALICPRLAAIRRNYPDSRIMVQPAETPTATVERWRAATAHLEIDWLPALPIHDASSGITPIEAMLKAYIDAPNPEHFLFKTDLDARVRRRFRRLPHGILGVFGTLEYVAFSGFPYGDFPNVQGGCYGLSFETARRILDGQVLFGDVLRKDPGVWVDGIADWSSFAEHGRVQEDGLLRWITKRMGMQPFAFEEINSLFRRRGRMLSGDFAVTHPHKTLEPDEGRGSPISRTRSSERP